MSCSRVNIASCPGLSRGIHALYILRVFLAYINFALLWNQNDTMVKVYLSFVHHKMKSDLFDFWRHFNIWGYFIFGIWFRRFCVDLMQTKAHHNLVIHGVIHVSLFFFFFDLLFFIKSSSNRWIQLLELFNVILQLNLGFS